MMRVCLSAEVVSFGWDLCCFETPELPLNYVHEMGARDTSKKVPSFLAATGRKSS